MTKEEFIRNAIKNRKEDEDLGICCGINCNDCPYEGPKCGANVIYDLLDYIIELEEHKETNLEHSKPKYKLSRFECDLLDSCYDYMCFIKDSWMLDNMHDKGYFKDIPNDVPIKDILDNCEVIDNG